MDAIKSITIRLTPDLHKKLKMTSIEKDKTLQELVVEILEEKINNKQK